MTDTTADTARASATEDAGHRKPRGSNGLFRAMWRWHFFAAFIVAPVLLVLASTGLIYLFRFQIEPLLHADLMKVNSGNNAVVEAYATQQEAVIEAYPDATIVSMSEPRNADRSTVFSIAQPDGSGRDVFVNPYKAEVLGSLNPENTVSGIALRIHGELMVGPFGDRVIELGACWAVVMALTGYYLFVRGWRARRRLGKSGRPGARLRSRHGLVGAFVGIALLTLLVSGLPWTGLWGSKVQELATDRGSSMWGLDPGGLSDPTSKLDESLPHGHSTDVPWAMGDSEVPRSTGDPEVSVANVDTALVVADREGLRHPMTVAMPADESGVFSVIGYAFDAPSDERTVHVDRYGGQVVSTYGFDDYPTLAKVVSHGIGLHEGRSLGLVSFWGAALACLAIMFLCLSGPMMWWRRRPKGSGALGAPRGKMPFKASPLVLVVAVVLGVLLPLFGVSLLVALILDQLVLRRVPALSAWFGTS